MERPVNHQFSLFDQRTMAPGRKVPISAARILEAKALMAKGDVRGSAEAMRNVREKLEEYESRIRTG